MPHRLERLCHASLLAAEPKSVYRHGWLMADIGAMGRPLSSWIAASRLVRVRVDGYRLASALLAWAAVLIASCRHEQTPSEASPVQRPAVMPIAVVDASQTTGNSPEDPIDASLIELIGSPERFRGRWVRVIGYAVLEFEGTAIFLHEEDYARGLVRNGLWLDVDRNATSLLSRPGYAIVEAQFAPEQHGHMSLFSGGLTRVGRLEPWAGRPTSTP